MATLERAATSRFVCAVCDQPIAAGAVRVKAKRSSHLACGIERDREQVLEALLNKDTSGPLVSELLAEIARLDPKLADEVRAGRRFKPTRVSKELDDSLGILAELEKTPSDRGLYEVLADHLQLIGDERGELIALDLAASEDPAAMTRRRELRVRLSPPFDVIAVPKWGYGFIRKLALSLRGGATTDHPLTHPSCRLLESLTLGTRHQVPILIRELPRTLRSLIVDATYAHGSDISELSYLEEVTVMHIEGELAHPTLRSLAITGSSYELPLVPRALPSLTQLAIRSYHATAVLAGLASRKSLSGITELTLEECELGLADHDVLEHAFADQKLAKLVIRPRANPVIVRERLQRLCLELEVPGSGPEDMPFVNHEKFGRGRILREFDGKLEIEFPSGKRTLKDGPYLKRSRD